MATPTDGFVRFCNYIHEREMIRLRRAQGQPWPWTKDPILQQYKFTNVQRKYDRTTQNFANIYRNHENDAKEETCLMNAATFRYFGTSEWAVCVGWQRAWSAKRTLAKAKAAICKGVQVFTGAYVVTNGGRHCPKEEVVVEYLAALREQAHDITSTMRASHSWKVGAELMYKVPGFGGSGFMTKEVLQDYLLMWPGKVIVDADTWTPVGPGARRGLNRIAGRELSYRQSDEKWAAECLLLRTAVNPHWKEWFQTAPTLTAHDVQFCCCEYDKYQRARLGEGHLKNKYRPPTAPKHLRNGVEIA